jgi:hypothetical protein
LEGEIYIQVINIEGNETGSSHIIHNANATRRA